MLARICLPFCLPDLFAKLFCPYFCPALFPAFSGQNTFHNRGPLKQSNDPELEKKECVHWRVLLIRRSKIKGSNLLFPEVYFSRGVPSPKKG